MAACPVVGHGRETDCAGTDSVRCPTGVTTGGESGAVSRTPTKTAAAASSTSRATSSARRRPGAAAAVRVDRVATVLVRRRRRRWRLVQRVQSERRHHEGRRALRAHLRFSPSSSSGVIRTARALEPSLGPTTPACSSRSMSRPARAKPTRSLRCSIDVDPSWRAHDEVARLDQQLVVVVVHAAAGPTARRRRCRSRRWPRSGRPAAASGRPRPHLLLGDPGGLEPARDVRGRRQQEHVPLADEALGTGLVEDDPAVGQRGDRERHAARDVGLDDPGDDVDRRALGGDAPGGCPRRGPSGRCARWSPRRRAPRPSSGRSARRRPGG